MVSDKIQTSLYQGDVIQLLLSTSATGKFLQGWFDTFRRCQMPYALQICIVEFALFKIGLPLGALCARLCEGRLKSFIFFSPNSLVQ